MTSQELAKKSADEILKTLGRDEETLWAMLRNKPRGGWRWSDEELHKELLLAGVVRILKSSEGRTMENPRLLSPDELRKVISARMDEIFILRKELSRKTGDMPEARKDVNFEKYVEE